MAVFYGDDTKLKAQLVAEVRRCCLHNGFFQIIGHKIPAHVQDNVFKCSKEFFDLSTEQKLESSKGKRHTGVATLQSQWLYPADC